MKTYHYDEETKVYTHSEDAFLDPLETQAQGKEIYLLPANATFEMPDFQEGYAPVWNGEGWENIEDNRGKEYWLDTDGYGTPARTMEELGALPENAVFAEPKQSVGEAKRVKIAELKSERDRLEVEPIEYDYHFFDYDEKARDRINAAIMALDLQGEGATIAWTTADNDDVDVTANDLRGVVACVAARSNLLHIQYRQLKTMVNACTTVEEVEEIRWESV